MAKWLDETSYSKSEKTREIRTIKAKIGAFRLVITRHTYDFNKWFVRCDPFWDLHELKSDDLEEAKAEAVEMFDANLRLALAEIN